MQIDVKEKKNIFSLNYSQYNTLVQYQNLDQMKSENIINKKSVINNTTEVHVGADIAYAVTELKIYDETKKR